MEIWKVFNITTHKIGYGKTYNMVWEVSTMGRFRCNGKERTPRQKENGYLLIQGNKLAHRIVAEIFIPNPENKPCIDHINGNKTDNRVENLQWATYTENNNNPITKNKLIETLNEPKNRQFRGMKISKSKKGKYIGKNNPNYRHGKYCK